MKAPPKLRPANTPHAIKLYSTAWQLRPVLRLYSTSFSIKITLGLNPDSGFSLFRERRAAHNTAATAARTGHYDVEEKPTHRSHTSPTISQHSPLNAITTCLHSDVKTCLRILVTQIQVKSRCTIASSWFAHRLVATSGKMNSLPSHGWLACRSPGVFRLSRQLLPRADVAG